jgi:hypothetical protein
VLLGERGFLGVSASTSCVCRDSYAGEVVRTSNLWLLAGKGDSGCTDKSKCSEVCTSGPATCATSFCATELVCFWRDVADKANFICNVSPSWPMRLGERWSNTIRFTAPFP